MKQRPFEQLVPKRRRDPTATWQIEESKMRTPAENKAHTAPALGDVDLIKTGDGSYTVKRNGATVASGVALADVLRVIRGEIAVEDLGANG